MRSKHMIALLLTAALLLSLWAPVCFAVSENLVTNGDLELGTTEGFALYGPANVHKASEQNAHEGAFCLAVSERAGRYSTVLVDLTNILAKGGQGTYEFTFWARLKQEETGKHKCQLAVNYAFEGEGDKYLVSETKALTTEWQKFTLKKEIDFDLQTTKHVWLYPQVEGETNADFLLDDVSVVKHGELNGQERSDVEALADKQLSDELSFNGDFEINYWDEEEGDDEDEDDNLFDTYGPDFQLVLDGEYAHAGELGAGILKREGQYSTLRYVADEVIADGGTGSYLFTLWVRAAFDDDSDKKIMLVVNYATLKDGTQYITGDRVSLTTEWQKLSLTFKVDFKNAAHIWLYPQISGEGNPSFCMDDFSLRKVGEYGKDEAEVKDEGKALDKSVIENLPEPVMTPISVAGKARQPLTVGMIRWDAWYGHQKDAWEVCNQVEKTLSPAKYHFRAPFFAKVTDEGNISFGAYTQEIFDREMEYAIQAGVDYFIYNWYTDKMRTARDLHATSQYKDQVKFCALLAGDSSDQTKIEMAALLQESYYMTVFDGRPLMYYFGEIEAVKNDIAFYRSLCQKLGLPAPYAVVMNIGAQQTASTGADAISNYATTGTGGESFASLAGHAEAQWQGYRLSGLQFVPSATAGWSSVPRYDNPVTWLKVGPDSYAAYGTPEEIAGNLQKAIEYINTEQPAKTVVNTVIMYAWNEHDEGGWICPTIKVDEEGKQLFDENGTPLIDTSRLEAVGKTIKAMKEKYQGVSPSEEPDQHSSGGISPLVWAALGGGAAVIVAAAVVFVIVKRKKAKKHEEA